MPHLRKRVLYVDNDDDTCLMMKVFLEMWDYDAVIARTATAALQQVQAAPYDAYLLDTHLPVISGLKLCEQICGVPGHAPVVFISAAAYETDKQRGLKAGAIAYHTKPLDFEALEITLTWIVQGAMTSTTCVPLGQAAATRYDYRDRNSINQNSAPLDDRLYKCIGTGPGSSQESVNCIQPESWQPSEDNIDVRAA